MKINLKANLCPLTGAHDLLYDKQSLQDTVIAETNHYIRVKYVLQPIEDERLLAYFNAYFGKPNIACYSFQFAYREPVVRDMFYHKHSNSKLLDNAEVSFEAWQSVLVHVGKAGLQALYEIACRQTDRRIERQIADIASLLYKEVLRSFYYAYEDYTETIPPTVEIDNGLRDALVVGSWRSAHEALAMVRKVDTGHVNLERADFDFHMNCEWPQRNL